MLEQLDYITSRFVPAQSIREAGDQMLQLIEPLGFNSFVYDYSPVARGHDGSVMTPSHITMLNVPDDMRSLWCAGGYYQRDPVQHMSVISSTAFTYSCALGENRTVLARCMTDHHMPVVSYLNDVNMISGVSVPIRDSTGALATCTAILRGRRAGIDRDARRFLSAFSLLGYAFHEQVWPLLDPEERLSNYARLTPRERECLLYSSDGLITKEIAHRLNRTEATVTMHLQSAARKLRARNRLHAVVLAHHYRLL